jgi:hypothetical protein
MFFIAREFLLVMYDEYTTQSATKRISMIGNRRSAAVYAEFNVEKIDEDNYKTLRRSHNKLS